MADQKTKQFNVSVESDTWAMKVSQIWPDGDAPENPTPADVAEQMGKDGSVAQIILEWALTPHIVIEERGVVAVVRS